MNIYIVQAVCNFDDVIVGCYDNEEDAIARCQEVVDNPELRHDSGGSRASNTEFLRCIVLKGEVMCTKFDEVHSVEAKID